jgi:hypothetical protein
MTYAYAAGRDAAILRSRKVALQWCLLFLWYRSGQVAVHQVCGHPVKHNGPVIMDLSLND